MTSTHCSQVQAIEAEAAQHKIAATEEGRTDWLPAMEESMKAKVTEATKRTIT